MIRKRQISMIVCGVLFLVLLIAFLAVVRPLTRVTEEVRLPPDLLEGEALDNTGNYRLMFPHIPREKIARIEVSGAEGEYKVERKVLDGETTFVINGYDGISYQDEAFSSVIVSAGYTMTRERLSEHGTPEELERYGLDKPQLTWTITDTSDNSYTVNVGDRLISGEGYYAMVEGRDAIYIISTGIESSLLLPVESFINPILCAGMTQDTYVEADNFLLAHGKEPFISVKQSKKEEFTNPDAQRETKVIYPAAYKTNDSYFFNIIATFMSLSGEEAVYLGEDPEVLKTYGLDLEDPDEFAAHSVYFTYGDIEYYMFFSELQDGGFYYATSNLTDYKVISKISADKVPWLQSKLSDWVYSYPIMFNITYVDSVEIETPDNSIEFDLIHGVDSNGKPTLEVEADNGFTLSNSDVYNFREFYKVIIAIQIMGDSELTEEAKAELLKDSGAYMATVRFNMKDGNVNEYKFYRYSTRRALLTSNGDGTFYVVTDWIEKLINDMDRLQKGLEVDSFTKV